MLVLSRRKNEQIVLPGLGVTVEVLKCSGGTVKLGINAPEDIRILRGELAWGEDRVDQNDSLHISNLVEAA